MSLGHVYVKLENGWFARDASIKLKDLWEITFDEKAGAQIRVREFSNVWRGKQYIKTTLETLGIQCADIKYNSNNTKWSWWSFQLVKPLPLVFPAFVTFEIGGLFSSPGEGVIYGV